MALKSTCISTLSLCVFCFSKFKLWRMLVGLCLICTRCVDIDCLCLIFSMFFRVYLREVSIRLSLFFLLFVDYVPICSYWQYLTQNCQYAQGQLALMFIFKVSKVVVGIFSGWYITGRCQLDWVRFSCSFSQYPGWSSLVHIGECPAFDN